MWAVSWKPAEMSQIASYHLPWSSYVMRVSLFHMVYVSFYIWYEFCLQTAEMSYMDRYHLPLMSVFFFFQLILVSFSYGVGLFYTWYGFCLRPLPEHEPTFLAQYNRSLCKKKPIKREFLREHAHISESIWDKFMLVGTPLIAISRID